MRIWKILGTFMVVGGVILSASEEARAAPDCGWSIEGPASQGLTTTVDEGTWVHVVVRCDKWQTANSGLTPPADLSGVTVTSVNAISGTVPGGWDGAFQPTKIGTTTYNFTVNVGSQTETQGVTITVKPKAPTAPSFDPNEYVKKDDFGTVRDDVDSLKQGNQDVLGNRGFANIWSVITPNLDATTTPAYGGGIEVGGKPFTWKYIDLWVTGQIMFQGVGTPVDPYLNPTSMSATMWMLSEQVRVGIAITDPNKIFNLRLGLGFGAKHYLWTQHVILQEANGGRVLVAEDNADHSFIFVPNMTFTVAIPRGVAIGAGMDVLIPTNHDYMVGRVPGGPADLAGQPLQTGQVEPIFKPIVIEARW